MIRAFHVIFRSSEPWRSEPFTSSGAQKSLGVNIFLCHRLVLKGVLRNLELSGALASKLCPPLGLLGAGAWALELGPSLGQFFPGRAHGTVRSLGALVWSFPRHSSLLGALAFRTLYVLGRTGSLEECLPALHDERQPSSGLILGGLVRSSWKHLEGLLEAS